MRAVPVFLSLALAVAPVAADSHSVYIAGGPDLAAAAKQACAAPGSPACNAALDLLAARATAALAILTDRRDPQLATLARQAADSAYPELRAAAAAALAQPYADATDTPLLAELADDPVPAVRMAALKALRSSNDPRAQALTRRADAFGSSRVAAEELAETPDAAPPAGKLGVPLPADAVFLFFGSDPEAGRFSYWTASSPAQVLAALRGKGKGPLTPAEFRAQTPAQRMQKKQEEAEKAGKADDPFANMPSGEDMERMMKMMEQMNKAAEQNQGKSSEEQAEAMAKAAKGMASFDQDLADTYEKKEIFGGASLFIVALADGGEAVVAVYADPAIGGTGITVHRAPLE